MVLELISIGIAGFLAAGYILYRRKARVITIPADNTQLNFLKLQPKISWCRFLEHVGDKGKKLAIHYQTIAHFEATSFKMLKQKFNANELTFGRYLQAVESSNLILIDNLTKLIPLLETLDTISQSELVSREALVEKIEGLFSLNEQLLEKLNELIISLSSIKNLEGPDESTTQFLLDNLDKLAERAKYY